MKKLALVVFALVVFALGALPVARGYETLPLAIQVKNCGEGNVKINLQKNLEIDLYELPCEEDDLFLIPLQAGESYKLSATTEGGYFLESVSVYADSGLSEIYFDKVLSFKTERFHQQDHYGLVILSFLKKESNPYAVQDKDGTRVYYNLKNKKNFPVEFTVEASASYEARHSVTKKIKGFCIPGSTWGYLNPGEEVEVVVYLELPPPWKTMTTPVFSVWGKLKWENEVGVREVESFGPLPAPLID